MSDHLANGEERRLKSIRLRMNRELVKQYEAINPKPHLSTLMNELLQDWLVTEQLKAEFKTLNEKS